MAQSVVVSTENGFFRANSPCLSCGFLRLPASVVRCTARFHADQLKLMYCHVTYIAHPIHACIIQMSHVCVYIYMQMYLQYYVIAHEDNVYTLRHMDIFMHVYIYISIFGYIYIYFYIHICYSYPHLLQFGICLAGAETWKSQISLVHATCLGLFFSTSDGSRLAPIHCHLEMSQYSIHDES